jgi:hypothetical protein
LITIHASDLGSCTKATVASLLGYEPRWQDGMEGDGGVFDQGHTVEAEVIKWLVNSEHFIFTTQQAEYLIPCGNVTGDKGEVVPVAVQCHTDGEGGSSAYPDCVVEVKSASEKSYAEWMKQGWERTDPLWTKYKWQVSAYTVATGKPVLFVVQSKADVAEGEEPRRCLDLVTEPFYTREQIIDRARTIGEHVAMFDLPIECDTEQSWFCPFRYLHEVTLDAGGDWEELARRYNRARVQYQAAYKSYNQLRSDLRRPLLYSLGIRMGSNGMPINEGTRVLDSGGVRVMAAWSCTRGGRLKLDEMVADGIDVEKYREGKKYGYNLRVTVREGKGERELGSTIPEPELPG